ncbi:MAG: helix-turn-helix transcriptional regulator [Bacteroidota bacterium]
MKERLSKKEIGNRFKALRHEKGVSQLQIATILNLSRSNYSQIELGNQYPTFDTLAISSNYYNKDYEWLLHGEKDNSVTNVSGSSEILPMQNIPFPAANRECNKIVSVLEGERKNYIEKLGNAEYIDSLPLFELPQSVSSNNNETYRAFSVSRNNKQLSLSAGDVVIGKSVNDYSELIFDSIYILVCSSEVLFLKISDFIIESRVFVCIENDGSQKTVKLAEVKELWIASGIYSSRSVPLVNDLMEQVDKLEAVLTSLQNEIKQLKTVLRI